MKSRSILPLAVAALVAAVPARAAGPLNVMTTTEDLTAIAREVGGDKIKVESMARGYQDPHFVEAKPSFMLTLNKADLLIAVGRELEIGWLPPLITQARNSKVQPGGAGYLDASQNAHILEIPTGQITRAMGDVHPAGNPHYWLEPGNGRRIAQSIQKRLSELDPADAAYFASRYADFDKRLAEAEKRWDGMTAPYKGTKIVTYHRSWPNFAERFGLNVIGYVEPKPGIPPSAGYLEKLVETMKATRPDGILTTPIHGRKEVEFLARKTGIRVIVIPHDVGATAGANAWISFMDQVLTSVR